MRVRGTLLVAGAMLALAGCGSPSRTAQPGHKPRYTPRPSAAASASPSPVDSPSASPLPSCLPATGKDDAALAAWVHDGGRPGHHANVGVLTLELPELTPPPCAPLTLRVSVFKLTVRTASGATGAAYTFSAGQVTTFSIKYDGHAQHSTNEQRIPVVGSVSAGFRCIGGLEVLYTGSKALQVAELPQTLQATDYGSVTDHLGGNVPLASFATKRVITAAIDYIVVDGC